MCVESYQQYVVLSPCEKHCVCFDCSGSDYISVETERLSSSNGSVNTVSHPASHLILLPSLSPSGQLSSKASHSQAHTNSLLKSFDLVLRMFKARSHQAR